MMRAHATGAEERVQEAAVQQPYESSVGATGGSGQDEMKAHAAVAKGRV